MTKYLFIFLFFSTIVNGNIKDVDTSIQEGVDFIDKIDPSVECFILEDENSIICKFETNSTNKDKHIIVQWIDPLGEISRTRNMLVPAGNGSIYDYRYIKGRVSGEWTFKVIENNKEFKTNFELK